MMESLGGWKRTCMCAELDIKGVGRSVTLMGWAQRRRDLGSLIFVWLRDRSGIVQAVFDQSKDAALFEKAVQIRGEYVLAVRGVVTARDEKNVNPDMATGGIEVAVSELKILSSADTLPFSLESGNVSDVMRLRYRYLDLRRPEVQRPLLVKYAVTKAFRALLDAGGFIDLETPMLTKSTPEGARDYLVPSRVHPGKFFALPQSPQLFKQLLMVSGFDRYYQITKCFRDEDLRANRQPEFQQVDIEMSFVDQEDVLDIVEKMLRTLFKELVGFDIPDPMPRLTYREAMEAYGSDKPDTRFGMKIVDIGKEVSGSEFKVFADALAAGGRVCAICAKGASGSISRKEIDALTEHVKTYKARGLIWLMLDESGVRSSISKFLSEDMQRAITAKCGMEKGDVLFMVADKADVALTALGQLRLELGRRLGLIPQGAYNLLWVTEFPLVEYSEGEGRYVAQHHPFTSPLDEDMALLETDIEAVRTKAYDVVCNGEELGGGSIRIHDRELQERIFRALGFTPEEAERRFGFLLDAFRYGAPPHGGIAFGLDRFTMTMAGVESIRDVIAFPKVQSSADLMTDAPSEVDEKQLRELSIRVEKREGGE
jgi:aspartyl-tRNA synthetase